MGGNGFGIRGNFLAGKNSFLSSSSDEALPPPAGRIARLHSVFLEGAAAGLDP